jgi:hypothetical protein
MTKVRNARPGVTRRMEVDRRAVRSNCASNRAQIDHQHQWHWSENTPAEHLVSVARVELFLQWIQFQNPGNFGDRFWMRESAVTCRNYEF